MKPHTDLNCEQSKLDSVHQGVDKAFRWASITFRDTYNSQWASPTARCGLNRAARSLTAASRPLEPLYEIVYEIVILFSHRPLPNFRVPDVDVEKINDTS